MLTPIFSVSQTEALLTITVRAPYTKPSEAEVSVNGNEFLFYCSPYYLRLSFSHNIVDDERSEGKYDFSIGEFTFSYPKLINGEDFENLNLLTALLSTAEKKSGEKPLIEVIDDGRPLDDKLLEKMCQDGFEWYFPQKLPEITTSGYNFGFNQSHSEKNINKEDEFLEVIDLRNPGSKSFLERRQERLTEENDKFSSDHYIENLLEESELGHLFQYNPQWAMNLQFKEEDKDLMLKLKNKRFVMDETDLIICGCNMISILLAYVYDFLVNEGEEIVESAWNIKTLSATLSWFEDFSCVEDAIISFLRRSLCYPLYRNWKLSTEVVRQVQEMLQTGSTCVVKSFLRIYSLFQNREPYYLLNKLYIADYCVWTQQQTSELFQKLAAEMKKVTVNKSDVGLELNEWEMVANIVIKEEQAKEICNVMVDMSAMKLTTIEELDSDDSTASEATSNTNTDSDDGS